MTEQDKQALIWRCRDAVAHLSQMVEVGIRGGRYSVTEYRYQLMINEIALTALTAQPVKLPQAWSSDNGNDLLDKDRVLSAIRAAGYEVQE